MKSVFDSNEHFIILVGLGGLTGTLLGKSIFKLLNNRNANFEFIFSFPFKGEGKMRIARAKSAFEEFKDYRQFKSFCLDDLIEYGNLTVCDAFRKAN